MAAGDWLQATCRHSTTSFISVVPKICVETSDITLFVRSLNNASHLNLFPPGLVFNEEAGICDWPFNTLPPCGTKEETEEEGEDIPVLL